MKTNKASIKGKQVRHDITRKNYLDPTSPGFLNER